MMKRSAAASSLATFVHHPRKSTNQLIRPKTVGFYRNKVKNNTILRRTTGSDRRQPRHERGTPFLRVAATGSVRPSTGQEMPFRATNAANSSSMIRIGAKMAISELPSRGFEPHGLIRKVRPITAISAAPAITRFSCSISSAIWSGAAQIRARTRRPTRNARCVGTGGRHRNRTLRQLRSVATPPSPHPEVYEFLEADGLQLRHPAPRKQGAARQHRPSAETPRRQAAQ